MNNKTQFFGYVFCIAFLLKISCILAAQVRINDAVLRLNTSQTRLLCNNVIINSNSCLSGSGNICAGAEIAGQVAPENTSVSESAQLTFSSNLVFISGSTFVCDVFSNTNCDMLRVSGTISGTGQVTAVKQADCVPLEQRIVIGSTASSYDALTVYEPQPLSWKLSVSGKELLLTDLRGDSNDNGMPDWWEVQYFGGRTNAAAQSDNDGDRSVNLGEYIAGTDPLQAGSCLDITPEASAGKNHILSWPGATGRTYVIYICTNMLTDTFTVLAQNVPAAVPLTVYTNTTFSTGSTYYKIQARLD